MMTFLDDLLAGGPHHRAVIDLGGAVIGPIDHSDEAIDAFQSVVDQIRANEGAGYRIHLAHKCRDRGYDLVDRITINIRD